LNSTKWEIAGHQMLDLALGGMVAGPKPFVGMEQQGRNEMRVEPPGDIAPVGNGDVMLA
jgi:hypothetical protein